MHWWKTSSFFFFLNQWYVVLYLQLWEHFTVHTQNYLGTKKSTYYCCPHRKYKTLQKVNQYILWGKVKKHWNTIFDDRINPFPPFLFTPPSPRIHNIHKRLFHQICSHSPFRYQDELLMCLSAASQMCKVRQHSAHLRKNALSQTNVLISDVFSPSSVLTGKCNFILELGLTHVETLWKDSAKVDITLMKASCLHQSWVKSVTLF